MIGFAKSESTIQLQIVSIPFRGNFEDFTITIGSMSLDMIAIEDGTFFMGSPSSESGRNPDESPLTEVSISRGFWIGKTEVTQLEYETVTGLPAPSDGSGQESRGGDFPVQSVNWFQAEEFCALLTDRERDAGRLPEGFVYSLPTEAQWEYACRAGTAARFSFGDDLDGSQLKNYAVYGVNSSIPIGGNNPRTRTVGGKLPNPWGFYDIHGNVWEWCLDFKGSFPGGVVTDPTGPLSGSTRVYRGTSLSQPHHQVRSAERAARDPGTSDCSNGFRIVLTVE